MRIGTWNLAGRRSDEHGDFLLAMDCDVLLLTEVNVGLELPGYVVHHSAAEIAPKRRWAAVASRIGLVPEPDPHPASAMARAGGLAWCSSILPWRSCGTRGPWVGSSHAEKTTHATKHLLANLGVRPLVWGGDWNHALSGREHAGSIAGRRAIQAALSELDLTVPTAHLPHQIEGLLTIDHIAVAKDSHVHETLRLVATVGDRRLSDHDAYVVQVASA